MTGARRIRASLGATLKRNRDADRHARDLEHAVWAEGARSYRAGYSARAARYTRLTTPVNGVAHLTPAPEYDVVEVPVPASPRLTPYAGEEPEPYVRSVRFRAVRQHFAVDGVVAVWWAWEPCS